MLWQRDFSVGVTAFSVRVAGFLVGVGGFCVGFNCVFCWSERFLRWDNGVYVRVK